MNGYFQNLLWFVVFVVGVSFSASGQNGRSVDIKLSDTGTKAYDELRETETFAMGGTGYAGTTSKGELALRQLIKETNAKEALLQLIEDATPEGGLYALVGLRGLDNEQFEAAAKTFLDKSEADERDATGMSVPAGSVKVMSGCLIFVEKRATVVKNISSGQYDRYVEKMVG